MIIRLTYYFNFLIGVFICARARALHSLH